MKKIAFIITLLFAFTYNVSAQEAKKAEKKDFTEVAQNEAYELAEYLELSQDQAEDFTRLFVMKYETLDQKLSEERNTELMRIVDSKIRASLTSEQIKKYDENAELKAKLLNAESK
jgi:hypothetical protein